MRAITQRAAQWLFTAHRRKAPFGPFPQEFAPSSLAQAYAVQDAFVALKERANGVPCGYKIALTTAQMRRLVGLEEPLVGTILSNQLRRTPGEIRSGDYQHLLIEFELAFEIATDLTPTGAPYSRERVAQAVGALMPAFELADDRHADYRNLNHRGLELAADNCWNEGAVLGEPITDWRGMNLEALRGRAFINGEEVGTGTGADVMGNPLEALAWVANHLAARERTLRSGDVILTGSLITSKFPVAGDQVRFDIEALGAVKVEVR